MSVNVKPDKPVISHARKISSKLSFNNYIKQNKPKGNNFKSKIHLKTINENDKSDLNISKKLKLKIDTLTSNNPIGTSPNKECKTERLSLKTTSSFHTKNSNIPSSSFKKVKPHTSSMSLNLSNLTININLSQNKIPLDEYRELFTKIIRDDYSNAILTSLLDEEECIEGFLSHHEITEKMRIRMVDWMIEVLSNYHCEEETYFESISLMDRYFKTCGDKEKVLQPNELHLIGVTSMFIASKFQEIYPLRLKIIHEKIAHKKLSCDEIKNKEEEISKTLNYSIGKPNIWDFINIFIEEIFLVDYNNHYIKNNILIEKYYGEKKNKMNKEMENILNKLYTKNMVNLLMYVCLYLAKMNCHDYNLMQRKPSLLAASTIYVAIKICEQINKEEYVNEYFTSKLNEISQKKESDIIETAQKILHNAKNFDTIFSGVDNLKRVHFNAILELKNTK